MDYSLLMDTINQGVASVEHEKFVTALKARRQI